MKMEWLKRLFLSLLDLSCFISTYLIIYSFFYFFNLDCSFGALT